MDLEVAAIHSQTDKSSAVVTRSLGISTTAISRSDAGRATDGLDYKRVMIFKFR